MLLMRRVTRQSRLRRRTWTRVEQMASHVPQKKRLTNGGQCRPPVRSGQRNRTPLAVRAEEKKGSRRTPAAPRTRSRDLGVRVGLRVRSAEGRLCLGQIRRNIAA